MKKLLIILSLIFVIVGCSQKYHGIVSEKAIEVNKGTTNYYILVDYEVDDLLGFQTIKISRKKYNEIEVGEAVSWRK